MVSWFKKNTPEANSDFASIASHELRTPLSVIKWYTEILLDGDMGELNDDQKKYLKVVEESNEKAIRLVTGLLNVSRIDLDTFSVSPEPLFVDEVLEEVLKKHKEQFSKNKISISFSKEGDFPLMNCDRNIITFLFGALVKNAIFFSRENGAVCVTLKGGVAYVECVVEDKGIGIRDDEKEKVFSKLFKGSNTEGRSGIGLDLFIAKTLLSRIGGTIYFSSKENIGSTFVINIPTTGMPQKKGKTKLEL